MTLQEARGSSLHLHRRPADPRRVSFKRGAPADLIDTIFINRNHVGIPRDGSLPLVSAIYAQNASL